jgi:hypothetical protein
MSFDPKSAAGDVSLTPAEQAGFAALAKAVQVKSLSSGNIPKDVQLVETQRGEALAEIALKEARGQANAWHRFYLDMLKLTAEGRAGFRKIIAKHAREMRAYVKDAGENPAHKKARNSALVHLSELTTISKAIDAGAVMATNWPYPYAVGYARSLLESQGKKDGRGRKATPWLDKVKTFLSKNVPAAEWDKCVDLVETMAAVTEPK